MSQRDVYSLIDAVIEDGRRRIAARDEQMMTDILAEYGRAKMRVREELMRLEDQIAWSVANRQEPLTEAWMRRQVWYDALDGAIQREAERMEQFMRGEVAIGRGAGAMEAAATWAGTMQAAPFLPTGNWSAVERWVSAIQPGSPVDRVLRAYGTNIENTFKIEITQGLIQGSGSSNITRTIMAATDHALPEHEAARIVRTETMRSYRGVYRDQVESIPNEMIGGYRWISALDLRTCPICLGSHGHVYENYPSHFHVMCRCDVVPVFSERYAPPREYQTGDQWLAQQPEEVQRSVLGPSRYEVWRDGTSMHNMIQVRQDPVWGETPRLIPVRDLVP